MTSPATAESTVANLKGAAGPLGLANTVRLATVVLGTDPGAVKVFLDGDQAHIPVGATSMVGALPAGARVYLLEVPPAGLYVVGYASPVWEVIGYASRPTSTPTTTSELEVLRNDTPWLVRPNQQYLLVTSDMIVDSSVASDSAGVRIRYTTDGSTPTTASPLFTGTLAFTTSSGGQHAMPAARIYRPTTAQMLRFVLTINRYAGTGTVALTTVTGFPIDYTLYALGAAVADTGVSL